jgi:hypothetical protein
MRSTCSMHGRLFPGADNLLFKRYFNSKGLLFLIYASHQYFTHYGSAYVQLKRHSNFNNMVDFYRSPFFYTGCIKKNATSEFPKKSLCNIFLSIKDFRPLGIENELLVDHITVVVIK